MVELVVELMVESMVESMVEPMVESMVESMVELMVEPIVEPIVEANQTIVAIMVGCNRDTLQKYGIAILMHPLHFPVNIGRHIRG